MGMKNKRTTRKLTTPATRKTSNLTLVAIAPQQYKVTLAGQSRMFKSASNAKAYVLGYLTANDWKNRG